MQIIGVLEKNIKYARGIHECRINKLKKKF
jgi:hypothetical protein